MKWPKAWIEAVREVIGPIPIPGYHGHWETSVAILDALDKIGALKSPPQPHEIWWCPNCHRIALYSGNFPHEFKCAGTEIKMREITDSDE